MDRLTRFYPTKFLFLILFLSACTMEHVPDYPTFAEDVALLGEDATVLQDGDSRVLLSTRYQGRVMTSSARGENGLSLGWLNRPLIAQDTFLPHITPVGGEERFWLGPEGGQYGLFFPPGAPFTFEAWQTPPAIDREPFVREFAGPDEALFSKEMELQNQSGSRFELKVERTIRLLRQRDIATRLGIVLPDTLASVAYETRNAITNTGDSAWTEAGGGISIWLLGMLPPSPQTVVFIPFRPGPEDSLGPVVVDTYFGKVPAARLQQQDSLLFFKADGRYRSKIGIPGPRAKNLAGSYDPVHEVLTFILFDLPAGPAPYVNSLWEQQAHPYAGDAVNAYNDGPLEDGSQLGPFYELESSSPAAFLAPGESLVHRQMTVHVTGTEAELAGIFEAVMKMPLSSIPELKLTAE